jgi:hypothetical protein
VPGVPGPPGAVGPSGAKGERGSAGPAGLTGEVLRPVWGVVSQQLFNLVLMPSLVSTV